MPYEIEQLTRVFDGRLVLNISKLKITPGQIHALLGPNGSGKTTLLNLLAFLDKPSSGTINFKSEPVSYRESALVGLRRKVVLVEQYPILFTTSVYKNLEFGLKIRKIDQQQRCQKIEQALALVGMDNFINAPAQTLSGGETKRVALARALVLAPDVLLCDEPFANVDQKNQAKILTILRKINSRHGISIIFSSHDRPLAKSLAHASLHLENGCLAKERQAKTYTKKLERMRRWWGKAKSRDKLE